MTTILVQLVLKGRSFLEGQNSRCTHGEDGSCMTSREARTSVGDNTVADADNVVVDDADNVVDDDEHRDGDDDCGGERFRCDSDLQPSLLEGDQLCSLPSQSTGKAYQMSHHAGTSMCLPFCKPYLAGCNSRTNQDV